MLLVNVDKKEGKGTMQKYVEEFRADLDEFHEMTGKFYRGEISIPEYKAFSGGFGSYAQRGGERSMLRLRLSCGEINMDYLKFIADSVKKYKIDMVHLTTCQTIQLHNLTEDTVCALSTEALEHGIITRGGGGDFPRNVMASPLAGVEKDEYFDVTPYAKEAARYLLGFIKMVKFPRKLKVCFSSDKGNVTHATFRDLGFVAKENGTFDVYAAGGLGVNPKFGVLVAEDIEPQKVLYCVKTMVDIFTQYGNYEQRARSRSRFLQDTLGVEELKRIYNEKLSENLKNEELTITVKPEEITKQGKVDLELEKENRIIAQKQPGLYAVSYTPIAGDIKPSFFEKIAGVIAPMGEVKIRLSPEQRLYIINLTAEEARKVLQETQDGGETAFECSTACIGADVCQVGIGKSRLLLQACVKRIREENLPENALPSVHISGCPSSCGSHQTAVIGLRGGKKPTPQGPKFAFALYENGSDKPGEEGFGTEVGVLLEDDIPDFFAELAHLVAKEGVGFEEYYKKHPACIKETAKKYLSA